MRLNIFPDGGVARFRVFGRVAADWAAPALDRETRAHAIEGSVDLAAVTNGGLALACSDAFFGPMNNLLLPGRAENMGGGWETRRKRVADPAHDWILIRLGARGTIGTIEVDTNHFKGNYPDRCAIEGLDAAGRAHHRSDRQPRRGRRSCPRRSWPRDERRFFTAEIAAHGAVTHVRLEHLPRRRRQPPAAVGHARRRSRTPC